MKDTKERKRLYWTEYNKRPRTVKYKKEWYLKNSEVIKQKARDLALVRRYKITREIYNQLLIQQNYKCLICEIEHDKTKKGLVVDHDHITSKVRGLLCDHCNNGLGRFKDNSKLLYKAFNYLKTNEEN